MNVSKRWELVSFHQCNSKIEYLCSAMAVIVITFTFCKSNNFNFFVDAYNIHQTEWQETKRSKNK